jgi:hypothetical protein
VVPPLPPAEQSPGLSRGQCVGVSTPAVWPSQALLVQILSSCDNAPCCALAVHRPLSIALGIFRADIEREERHEPLKEALVEGMSGLWTARLCHK